jgi:hypothetical protein
MLNYMNHNAYKIVPLTSHVALSNCMNIWLSNAARLAGSAISFWIQALLSAQILKKLTRDKVAMTSSRSVPCSKGSS